MQKAPITFSLKRTKNKIVESYYRVSYSHFSPFALPWANGCLGSWAALITLAPTFGRRRDGPGSGLQASIISECQHSEFPWFFLCSQNAVLVERRLRLSRLRREIPSPHLPIRRDGGGNGYGNVCRLGRRIRRLG